jgi:hypothetical protein
MHFYNYKIYNILFHVFYYIIFYRVYLELGVVLNLTLVFPLKEKIVSEDFS